MVKEAKEQRHRVRMCLNRIIKGAMVAAYAAWNDAVQDKQRMVRTAAKVIGTSSVQQIKCMT
jgi:hypothetical protein